MASTAGDYASESRARWERMAPGWERQNERQWRATEAVSRDLVHRLGPAPGDVVLELAAGIGQTGLLVADRVGPGGRVISTDFAPAMVDAARRLAQRTGATGMEHRVMDAENLVLPDASVDGVVCRWGLMLFADSRRALAEIRRVLKPGGRLACSVWARTEANPWAVAIGRALVAEGAMEPPDPDAPGMFSLADAARLQALLHESGFATVGIGEVPIAFEYADFDEYWALTLELGGGVAEALASLPPGGSARVREAAERNAAPYRGPGGYSFPGLCLNAAAE